MNWIGVIALFHLVVSISSRLITSSEFDYLTFRKDPRGRRGYGTFTCDKGDCPDLKSDIFCLADRHTVTYTKEGYECFSIFLNPVEITSPKIACNGTIPEGCNLVFQLSETDILDRVVYNYLILFPQYATYAEDMIDDVIVEPVTRFPLLIIEFVFSFITDLILVTTFTVQCFLLLAKWNLTVEDFWEPSKFMMLVAIDGLVVNVAIYAVIFMMKSWIDECSSICRRRKVIQIVKTEEIPASSQDKECLVCRENEKVHAAIPCGHLLLCDACVVKHIEREKCFLCAKEIEKFQRIFQ